MIVVTLLSVAGYVLSFWGFRLTRHSRRHAAGQPRPADHPRRPASRNGGCAASNAPNRCCSGPSAAPGCRPSPPVCGIGDPSGAVRCWCRPPRCARSSRSRPRCWASAELGHATLWPHGPAARPPPIQPRRRGRRCWSIVALFARSAPWWLAGHTGADRAAGSAGVGAAGRGSLSEPGTRGDGRRLITRVGSLVRRRSALAVPGVIGVTLRQSVFQRRSGLISLTATTAAGAQHYEVPDLPQTVAIDLAVRLLPQSGSSPNRPRPSSLPCCATSPASADCLDSRGNCGPTRPAPLRAPADIAAATGRGAARRPPEVSTMRHASIKAGRPA